jgi:hypothetical protein
MAIGRQDGIRRTIERAPRRGPQAFITGLLRGDVLGYTITHRAAELSAQPMFTSRTYYGAYKPGTAQRIPPLIPSGYGGDYASSERVRSTLVARARLFRSGLALNQDGARVAPVAAARSQTAKAAGA